MPRAGRPWPPRWSQILRVPAIAAGRVSWDSLYSKGGVFSEHIFAAHLRIPRPQGRVSSVRAAAVQAQWSPPCTRVLSLKRCPARLCATVPQEIDTRHWSVVCVAYTYCIPGATHRAHVLVCRVLSLLMQHPTGRGSGSFFAARRGRRLLVGGGLAVLPLRHTTASHEWGISWSVCACVTRLIGYTLVNIIDLACHAPCRLSSRVE